MSPRLSLEERVKRLIARLDAKHGVDQAFLFGSTAIGNRLEGSDVDIIVVSRGFEGISVPERQGLLQREWEGPEELHALAYTPDEFATVSSRATMREILSYAVDLTPYKGVICPRCGRRGSRQVKVVRNRSGRAYHYLYYAHHRDGRVKWCYIGAPPTKST